MTLTFGAEPMAYAVRIYTCVRCYLSVYSRCAQRPRRHAMLIRRFLRACMSIKAHCSLWGMCAVSGASAHVPIALVLRYRDAPLLLPRQSLPPAAPPSRHPGGLCSPKGGLRKRLSRGGGTRGTRGRHGCGSAAGSRCFRASSPPMMPFSPTSSAPVPPIPHPPSAPPSRQTTLRCRRAL